MAASNPPVNGVAFVVYVALADFATPGSYKATPTLATGDVKVSIDGGALNNLATLPTNTPAASVWVKLSLSAAEMTGDNISVQFIDQTSPKEWADYALNIQTTLANVAANIVQVDGVALGTHAAGQVPADARDILGTAISAPATAGILDVNLKNIANAAVNTASAQLGVNAVNHGGTAQTGRDIGASVLLSSGTGAGQLDFTSGVVKANLAQILGTVLTETAGQIAAAFKQFFNIASPTSTMNVVTTVTTTTTATTATNLTNAPTNGDFTTAMKTSLNNATPAVTVSDKTGFSLSTAGIQAIWDALTSALTTAGSIGKLLVDNINATISSRSTYAGGAVASVTAGVTVTTNNDKTGYALTSAYDPAKTASQAGDAMTLTAGERTTLAAKVWDALLTGITTASTIGKLIKDNLDAAISTRTKPADTQARVTLVDTITTYTGNTPQTGDSYARLGAPVGASISADIAEVEAETDGITAIPTNPLLTNDARLDNLDAAVSSRSTYVGADTAGTTTLLARVPGTVQPQTGDSFARLGAPAGASVSADIAEVESDVDLLSAATDPWGVALPGAYAAGTAGKIVGDNLDAAISSRLATSGYSAPDNADIVAIKARTDNLPSDPADASDVASAFSTVNGTLATIAGYIDTEVAAIKAKTDNLPAVPAAVGSAMTLTAAYDPAKTAAQAGNAMTLTSGERTTLASAVWAAATRLLTAGTNIVLAKGTGVTGFNDLSAAQVNTEADTALSDVGLTSTVTGRVDVPVSTRLATTGYTAPDNATILAIAGYVDTEVGAIKARTDLIPNAPAAVGSAMTLTTGERTSVADAIFKRDWSAISGEAARSLLNAGRKLMNRVAYTAPTLTVYQEDDATPAYTQTATSDAHQDPIASLDTN